MLNNKNIFITGGTGSFGKAFVKKVLKNYKPNKLVIYSRDELKQFEMRQEFPKKKFPSLRFLLGDVRDRYRLKIALRDINIVVHAAAQKHVEASEYNPEECIKTNIKGAENVVYGCIENKVEKVISLSTDKAVNPINLYGATKLVSDKLFVSANIISGKQKTVFSVVRYGNVLNSRGSVIPYFKKLISEKKNFLPLTHKSMSRFIISLDDGVDFVINSLKKMYGGEIFVPKIPAIRIIDLIKALKSDIKIKVIGIKPGEKLHEVLCPKDENSQIIEFKKFYLIAPTIDTNVKRKKYFIQKNGEKGKIVNEDFEYSSDKVKLLKVSDIQKLLDK
tara:strand:+ start:1126 stop:2124 length:999 start_codon:yes stop_codon:yes gene_type:complete